MSAFIDPVVAILTFILSLIINTCVFIIYDPINPVVGVIDLVVVIDPVVPIDFAVGVIDLYDIVSSPIHNLF